MHFFLSREETSPALSFPVDSHRPTLQALHHPRLIRIGERFFQIFQSLEIIGDMYR